MEEGKNPSKIPAPANIMSFGRGELVAYDVPAVAARRRTGSITGRDWA